MASLDRQLVRIENQVNVALSLLGNLHTLETVPRHYVAELIIIRVFAMFESVVEEIACNLVCGAAYCDGSHPHLLRPRPTRGPVRAIIEMQQFGRVAPRERLRWTKPSEISKNIEYLFPITEHFPQTISTHGQLISDIRKVRNHIAHSNAGTRRRFQEVVKNYYGANVHGLTPGRMLLSYRFTPTLAEKWCKEIRIILKTAVRG